METKKPLIMIYVAGGMGECIKQVAAGIEEEGVFFQINERKDEKDAYTLAEEASEHSSLHVGIGARADKVVVAYSKLKIKNAFLESSSIEKKVLRNLGSNAARLVKGSPLKIGRFENL